MRGGRHSQVRELPSALKTMDKKQPKDPKKERLAKQLRANLQRRKEQARERQPGTGDGGPEGAERDAGNPIRRDT
jgi:hypothetical protein